MKAATVWPRGLILVLGLTTPLMAQETLFTHGFESPPAPVIESMPPTTATVDELYFYDVEASDSTGTQLIYLLTTSPVGMAISPTSGIITWTPQTAGDVMVEVDVSNALGGAAIQSWTINVQSALDSDSDGLSDVRELIYGTDPGDPDSDDDDLLDGEEVDTYGSDPLDPDSDGDGETDGDEVNTQGTDPIDPDTDDDFYGDGMEIIAGTDPLDPLDFPSGPPDPVAVAPPIDVSVATTVFADSEFIWNGAPPIQTGVTPGTIDPTRSAVMRGYVMERAGLPLPGVVITILDHPEYGQTMSRADGMYDMVVNGGEALTIDFLGDSFLPGQRRVHAEWQTYHRVPDMALVPLDPQMTAVDLDTIVDFAVAQGSEVTDGDGARQAAVLFPQGTTAMMRLPDDSLVPITNLSVRATEYTVGENGPSAMPGELPPNSAYTYAVELSIDEAIMAGAVAVEFNNPIPYYVDNFLGFPSGIEVPSGYYDRQLGSWVAADNGLVIDVLDEVSGLAILDIDDSGTPATMQELMALGITDAEREEMALLYDPGDSFWRVRVPHFSGWDSNWGFSPPPDATPPMQSNNHRGPSENELTSCENTVPGSTISCQNQLLGKRVGLTGTDAALNYSSRRVPDYRAAKSVQISLSSDTLPASLDAIQLKIQVAGQLFTYEYPPLTNQSMSFVWNGKDAYGRKPQGAQHFSAEVAYRYQGVYGEVERFGYNGNGTLIVGIPGRNEVLLPERYDTMLTSWDARAPGLGGWTLDHHHHYDPNAKILYRGDGSKIEVTQLGRVLSTLAGQSSPGYGGDGGPATEAQFNRPMGVATAPDGTVYIADQVNQRVRRIDQNGIITTVAGTGDSGYNGDEIPATSAELDNPRGVAFSPDGELYISEDNGDRVRRVDHMGIIHTFAGNGSTGFSGDGGPATQAEISGPEKIGFGPNGDLYIADSENERLRRVDSEGIISTVAGNGDQGYNGDNIPAVNAELSDPSGVAVDPQGNLYISDSTNYRIRKVDPNGIITTFAGTGAQGFSGDGGLAVDAQLGQPAGISLDDEGTLFIADDLNHRIRAVGTDGIITTVVGSGPVWPDEGQTGGNGDPANLGRIKRPEDVKIGADGRIIIGEFTGHNVRAVTAALPGFNDSDILLPSVDGSQLFRFDIVGKHLQTFNSLTGAVMYEFFYTPDGSLDHFEDGDGKTTQVQRNGSGEVTAIVSPFGQSTAIQLDQEGYIQSITNLQGESLQIGSTVGGLIIGTVNPRGRAAEYGFDTAGRLISQSDNSGYSQQFSRMTDASGYEVTRTTGLGRALSYTVDKQANGDDEQVVTAPDGSQFMHQNSVTLAARGGTLSTGVTTTTTTGPDPRFDMRAPVITSIQVEMPGGPTMSTVSESSASLSDPADPLSLISLSADSTLSGRTTTTQYTAANRTLVLTSPEGRTTTTVFDAQGRVTNRQFADLAPLSASYNLLGQLETLTSGTGMDARITSFTYGADGFRESLTDPLGRVVMYQRNASGEVIGKSLPGGVNLTFVYNGAGDMGSLIPPDRPAHHITYDRNGRVLSITPPAVAGSGPTLFTYNDDRQLTSITQPGNEVTTFIYDAEGRPETITLAEAGMQTASYSYNYLAGNQLHSVVGPDSQQVTLAYQGVLLTSTSWSNGVAGSVSHTYDDAFRAASESVNGGNTIAFSYDDDDLPIATGTFTLSRDAVNGLAVSSNLGVVGDAWTQNDFGETDTYAATANAVPVYSVTYTRDKLGQVTGKTETVEGSTQVYTYEYGPRGQLTQVVRDAVIVENYSYDDNGNRLTATVEGDMVSANYDDQDRVVTYGGNEYIYSPAGRLLTRTEPGNLVTQYDYDIIGNLKSVTLPDSTVISYEQDGFDRRIERKVDDFISDQYLYSGHRLVAQLDDMGSLVNRFVYLDSLAPAYMVRGGVDYRLITDQLGSIRLVVNAATGAIAQRMDYDSFGNVTMDTNPGFQPFGFAGGLYDPDTGLVRFTFRDYDPQTGRWTAKDPTGFAGNDSNLYRYANNNPVNLTDYLGLDGWDKFLGFLAGVPQAVLETFNPFLFMQNTLESGVDYWLGDWLDENGFYRDPHPGKLQPPPPGADPADYAEGEFWGTCAVAVASLAAGAAGAVRNVVRGALGAAGSSADDLARAARMAKQFPARGEQFFHGEARVKQLEQANRARVAAEQAKAQQAAKDALGRLGSEGMSTPIGNGPKFGGGI